MPTTYSSATVNGVEKLLSGTIVEVRTVIWRNLYPAYRIAVGLPNNCKLVLPTRLNIWPYNNLGRFNTLCHCKRGDAEREY
jgi:hypothetical protein